MSIPVDAVGSDQYLVGDPVTMVDTYDVRPGNQRRMHTLMTGEYADANNGYHGYLRNAVGRFVEFTVPGGGTDNANGTYPFSMNIWGLVTGFSSDPNGNATGFVRFPDGTLDSFQAPGQGNLATFAYIGNALNEIVGLFVDANGTGHGFIALATP